MGLSQGDLGHQLSRALRAWSLPGFVVALATVLLLSGDVARDWLSYDRAAITDGEIWRLLTAHLVHLGWSHFALNAVGLVLICYLVSSHFTTLQWFSISLLTIAAIDLGFWVFEPQLAWYVGLSGLLHGLLAAGIMGAIGSRRHEAWILGAFLSIKLAYEQFVGPLPGSAESTGGAVIVAAHLYGALGGAVTAAWLTFRKPQQASI